MKISYATFRAMQEEAATAWREKKAFLLVQWRFVAQDWDGDLEDRVWAVVDDEDAIKKMREQISVLSFIHIQGRKEPVCYHPEQRPLLVIHTVR